MDISIKTNSVQPYATEKKYENLSLYKNTLDKLTALSKQYEDYSVKLDSFSEILQNKLKKE